jgi:hypothetical protein
VTACGLGENKRESEGGTPCVGSGRERDPIGGTSSLGAGVGMTYLRWGVGDRVARAGLICLPHLHLRLLVSLGCPPTVHWPSSQALMKAGCFKGMTHLPFSMHLVWGFRQSKLK